METTEWVVDLGEEYEHELVDGGDVIWGADEYIKVVGSDAPEYDGPYSAIPLWSDQTFATADHLMSDDFEVSRILELEVPNDAGGLTLTI